MDGGAAADDGNGDDDDDETIKDSTRVTNDPKFEVPTAAIITVARNSDTGDDTNDNGLVQRHTEG